MTSSRCRPASTNIFVPASVVVSEGHRTIKILGASAAVGSFCD